MASIGVLALQGGVVEHLEHLRRLEVAARPVKRATDLAGLAGLIIPGGESTCLQRLLRIDAIDEAIADRFHAGLKLWGTCAGAILLAKRVVDGDPGLALIDIEIARNAFGGQLDSFNTLADVPAVASAPIPLTFIRAPKILALGAGVRSLLCIDDYHAAAEDDAILVTVFHPELTPSLAFHRYFATKCGIATSEPGDAEWRPDGWTQLAPLPKS